MAQLEDVFRQPVVLTPVGPAAAPVVVPVFVDPATHMWNEPGLAQAVLHNNDPTRPRPAPGPATPPSGLVAYVNAVLAGDGSIVSI